LDRASRQEQAKAVMNADPDIVAERRALSEATDDDANAVRSLARVMTSIAPVRRDNREPKFVPLNVVARTHQSNADTLRLVRQFGGVPALQIFAENFYQKSFMDVHINKFILNHADPHGFRFASWVAEKMGDGTPWTQERKTRASRTLRINGQVNEVAFDRSSAHVAAWNCPKREPEKMGDHFKLDDARNWMRLHFWAAREVGMFDHVEFMDYYVRLIGHFVSIYSTKSPIFTRDSARWSADPANIKRYIDAGCLMRDVIGKPFDVAIQELPHDERAHTGSGHRDSSWPYESQPSMSAWMKCVS